MHRTANSIEETKAAKDSDTARKVSGKRGQHPNSRKNLELGKWKPGQSGHAGGRPKNDLAAEIARAVFEQNPEAIYKAMSGALLKGNAYVFKEIAERGYGKLKETKEVTHRYEDVPDADLNKRIAELESELGLAAQIDDAGRTGIAAARESEASVGAQDPHILP